MKLPAVTLTKVEVQQHKIDGLSPQDLESLFDRPAVGNNLKVRFSTQKPAHALTKQGMVVEQQNVNRLLRGFRRSPPPLQPRAKAE